MCGHIKSYHLLACSKPSDSRFGTGYSSIYLIIFLSTTKTCTCCCCSQYLFYAFWRGESTGLLHLCSILENLKVHGSSVWIKGCNQTTGTILPIQPNSFITPTYTDSQSYLPTDCTESQSCLASTDLDRCFLLITFWNFLPNPQQGHTCIYSQLAIDP